MFPCVKTWLLQGCQKSCMSGKRTRIKLMPYGTYIQYDANQSYSTHSLKDLKSSDA